MKKKGFTLVELLAVIVILSVILLIAVPAVKKSVDSAKKKSAENDAIMIKKIAEKYYASNLDKDEEITGVDLSSNELTYSGEKPTKGYMQFNEDGIAYGKMYISGYCVEIKSDGTSTSEKVSIDACDVTSTEVPTPPVEEKDTVAPTLNVTVTNTVAFNYTITVVTSDSSGIKEIRYYVNDTLVYSGSNLTYTATTSKTSNTYKIESEDNNGNIATKTGTFTVSTCFVAGTKVLTKDGLKNIEDIKIGDYVYAINLTTSLRELSLVTDTMISQNDTLYEITTTNGEVIKSTEKHEYYVLDKGWVRAYDLKVGDTLYSLKGSMKIKTIRKVKLDKPVNVYNFTVENNHNYLITEYEFLVHNAQSTPSKTSN